MDANNIDIGLNPEEYWVIHFDDKIRYLTDDQEDALWALKGYSENQDLPFKITNLSEFGEWCRLYGEEKK